MPSPTLHWITGASSGIGAELALRLAAAGQPVAVSARREDALAALASRQAGVHPFACDVTDAGAVADTVRRIEAELGPVQVAVLNAGDYRPMETAEMDAALMRRIHEVNFFGVVNAAAALLPGMLARGSGRLVINASVAGYRGLPLAAAYGPTKAALINLAETMRLELGPRGLVIQVINPGFVRTPLTEQNAFDMPALMDPATAAGRIVEGLASERFEITFPRRFTWLLKLMRCLPYALYFPLARRATGR